MLNVNQLTEQLRMMPDQALQRMAQMYKNDPYILPMLISEDTARKKLRQAAQAQAMQPQPKVVDQAVAAMGTPPQPAPGIAALQAPNMERMADGGIAGYAEGGVADTAEDAFSRGGMFDFSQRSEPVVRMAGGGVPGYADRGVVVDQDEARAQAEQKEMDEGKRGDFSPETKAYFRRLETERMAANEALGKRMVAQEQARGRAAYQTQGAAAGAPTATLPVAVSSGRGVSPGGPLVGEEVTYPALRGTVPPAAPSAGAVTPPPAATDAAAPAPARGPAVAQPSVASAKETAAQFLDRKEIERQAKDFEMSEVTAVDEARRRRQKAIDERQGKAYEGLEALLKKEEEGSKGELEQSKAFAILNAGLAMMAGTSPRALENIGKGAMVGTGQYADALKDFKKAAKERQRAMADIEQARRAEARADEEAMQKFEDSADARLANARKFGISALMEAGVKNADMARQIYTTQVEQQGAFQRTAMQVNALPAQLQTYKALGRAMGATTDDEAIKMGFGIQTREQRIPALYEQYVNKANSQKLSLAGKGTEGEEFLRQYPTFETYLRGMGVQPGVTGAQTGGGFVQPPAGAPILR